nr:hypothetical protein GZ31B6_14 [uncultured archaeon GZfos31B6]
MSPSSLHLGKLFIGACPSTKPPNPIPITRPHLKHARIWMVPENHLLPTSTLRKQKQPLRRLDHADIASSFCM